jgi:hypothetical protein
MLVLLFQVTVSKQSARNQQANGYCPNGTKSDESKQAVLSWEERDQDGGHQN